MEDRVITITLKLRLEDEVLTGRAENGAGPRRDFTGRLGLLAAIEALLGEQPRDAERPHETKEHG